MPNGRPREDSAVPADSAGAPAEVTTADPAPRTARERLDLNRASAAELDALPGVGPVLAARILEFRRRHGPFRSVDELAAVRGVGPALVERLRGRVRAGRDSLPP